MITALKFSDIFDTYESFKAFTDELGLYDDDDAVSELFNQSIYWNILHRYANSDLAYYNDIDFKSEFTIAYRQHFIQFLTKKKIIDDINKLTNDDYQIISESLSNFANNPNTLQRDPWELLTYTAQQQRGRAKAGKLTAYINALRQMPDAQIDAFLKTIDYMWLDILDFYSECNPVYDQGTVVRVDGVAQTSWSPDDIVEQLDTTTTTANTALERANSANNAVICLNNQIANKTAVKDPTTGDTMQQVTFVGKNGINVDKGDYTAPNTIDIRIDQQVLDDIDEAVALVAEVSAIDARALKTPLIAPVSTQIPTIGTNNAQNNVGVGSGLTIANDTLSIDFLQLYLVGDIFLSENATSPAQRFGGTWEELGDELALWLTATADADAGTIVSAGLPEIEGTFRAYDYGASHSGAFGSSGQGSYQLPYGSATGREVSFTFSAKKSNAIYGASDTVQPPARKIYGWKRIA